MTRINKHMRDAIRANALEKAGIAARKRKLIERRAAWAERVRLDSLGGKETEDKIEAFEAEFNAAIDGLPVGLVKKPLIRRGNGIYVSVGGLRVMAYFSGHLRHNGEHEVLKICPVHTHVVVTRTPLADEFTALENEASAIAEAEENIAAAVDGALSNVTSISKLLSIWPEAKELLPGGLDPHAKQLPAVRVESLNKLLGLPSGGEA